MFQESFILAAKLMVLVCAIALATTILLTRLACARLMQLSNDADTTDGDATRYGSHYLQRGVPHVYPQPH